MSYKKCLNKKDLKNFFDNTRYWRTEALKYRNQFKLLEFESITDTLWDILKSFDIAAYSSFHINLSNGYLTF